MNPPPARGTTPAGTADEAEAARWVRDLFERVVGRYDLLNHLLSFNLDRYWRARTVRRLRHVLSRPGARAMDICCGTGDLLLGFQRERPGAVMGSDFCHPMLTAAQGKIARAGFEPALVEADALALPLAAGSLDLITVAFGFRNLANYEKGLAEMRRVLKPAGIAGILEFSHPRNAWMKGVNALYFRWALPAVGRAVSGERYGYRYLIDSIRKFPNAEELANSMRRAGFREVRYEIMTGGVVALHTGVA